MLLELSFAGLPMLVFTVQRVRMNYELVSLPGSLLQIYFQQ